MMVLTLEVGKRVCKGVRRPRVNYELRKCQNVMSYKRHGWYMWKILIIDGSKALVTVKNLRRKLEALP